MSKKHTPLIQKVTNLPTFHSVGLNDQVVVASRGIELANLYENSIIMEHEGGHLIPNKAVNKEEYHKFLSQFVEQWNKLLNFLEP